MIVIVEGLSGHVVSIAAFLQSSIVQCPAKPKSILKFWDRRLSREYSEFVGFAGFQLLTFLAFEVLSHSFNGDAPSSSDKIRVRPQAREFTFQVWKLFSELMGACTLDVFNQSVNTELGITANQQMNVIGHNLKFDELLIPLFYYLKDDSFEPLIYWRCQHTTPVFRTENNVVSASVSYIIVSFNLCSHTGIIPQILDRCKLSTNATGGFRE